MERVCVFFPGIAKLAENVYFLQNSSGKPCRDKLIFSFRHLCPSLSFLKELSLPIFKDIVLNFFIQKVFSFENNRTYYLKKIKKEQLDKNLLQRTISYNKIVIPNHHTSEFKKVNCLSYLSSIPANTLERH